MKRSEFLPNYPFPPNYVRRPRLKEMLKHVLDNSLTGVIAGPGYGKTTMVSNHVAKLKVPIVWMTLSPLDNSTEFFWKTIIHAAEHEMPELAMLLSQTTFPESLQAMSRLVMTVVKDPQIEARYTKMLLVLDNCEMIKNQKLVNFFTYLQSVNLLYSPLKIHQVLIANENLSDVIIPPTNITYKNKHQIQVLTAKDLALNIDEIKQLFIKYGRELNISELTHLHQETEGWPFLLDQIAADNSPSYHHVLDLISKLFESYYYANYSAELQNVLIQLTPFKSFTMEILTAFLPSHCTKEELDNIIKAITHNPFVEFNRADQKFRFLPPYHRFLIDKFLTIGKDNQIRALTLAGDYILTSEDIKTVLELYIQTRNYQGISKYLMMLAPYIMETSYHLRLRTYLLQIPEEYRRKERWIDFFIALSHFKCYDLDYAAQLVNELLGEISDSYVKYSRLSAECEILLVLIQTYQRKKADLKKLNACLDDLPGGSILMNRQTQTVGENSCFFLPDGKTSIQEMIDYVYGLCFSLSKISNGCLAGFDYLFEAEARFFQCNYEQAGYYANQAIFKASIEAQHDIVINAYHILIRIAFSDGDANALNAHFNNLRHYFNQFVPNEYQDFRDILHAIYSFKLHNFENTAPWIKAADLSNYKEKRHEIGRNIMACALYALYMGNYPRVHALNDELHRAAGSSMPWVMQVASHVLYCISYLNLDKKEKALEAFRKGYDLVYKHDLFFPMMGFGKYLLPVLRFIKNSADPYFNYSWIKDLETKTKNYIRSEQKIANNISSDKDPVKRSPINLTSREKQVLSLLAQGLSRSEIASTLDISVSGVQKFLSNIYLKLGAKNGADAVSIALSNHIIL